MSAGGASLWDGFAGDKVIYWKYVLYKDHSNLGLRYVKIST
jgi:hypothetical protein